MLSQFSAGSCLILLLFRMISFDCESETVSDCNSDPSKINLENKHYSDNKLYC